MKLRQLAAFALILFLFAAIAPAHAQTYKVQYNFDGQQGGPEGPTGVLAQGPDGDGYGTSSTFGDNLPVDVFKVTPSGMLTVIHDFGLSSSLSPNGVTLGLTEGFTASSSISRALISTEPCSS